MKKGKIKEIPKLIKVFSITIICVFWYTAPNEDKSIQKNPSIIIPNIKNIIYLILKFFLTYMAISSALE